MWARAITSLFRYGKTLKSYGKGMTRSGTRVSGKSSSGKKISGVLKKDKKGGNYVVSNLGVPTRVTAENASKMVSRAKVRSNVRKGAAIGAVAGVGTLAASKTATNTSPEPTYTEKNPGGMRIKKAPESKYVSYSRLGQEITRMEKLDPKREKGYFPKMDEPVATEKNPMGMKFSAAPKMSTKKQTFSQAFAQARKQGEGTNFKWQGKSYTAVTKEDVKRAGAKNLRGYLNKKKKKKK